MSHRPVPLHRSLLVRLLTTSMLIAVCAIAATAWLTMQITKRAVTGEQSRTLSADTDVYDTMIAYAATHHSWDDVSVTVRRLAELTGRRIVLTTMDRKPIAGSTADAAIVSAVPTATVDPLYLDAGLARDSRGRIDPRAVGPYRLTEAERQSLRRIAGDQVDCLRTKTIHAEVVETPSGRPTVRVVSGDIYGTPLSSCSPGDLLAPVHSEEQPLLELTNLVNQCSGLDVGAGGDEGAAPRGRPASGISLTPMFTLQYGGTPLDPEREAMARRCVEDSRRKQLQPFVAPPALLFVTGPAAAPAPAVNLSPANTLRIVGTTAVVLMLAFVVTVLVGVRLVRPLRLLTDAARQPADGQERVSVTTRDEIGYLATAFNDLSERRRALEQQRKAMVNDIAHELRTPLTNIRTWLEAARDGVTDVDSEALDLLVEESILLHHVVDDLRDIAAADAGNLRIHPEPTFVKDVLGQVLDAHRGAAEAAGVRLDLVGDADPEVIVDPVRLRQIVGNLVSNAIRYTPTGGSVTVRIELRGQRLAIEVTDTGTGISAADLPKVFDRFWRTDRSRSRATGGSGLGLPIARQLARAHGGDITAASRPDDGSTFTVDLPT
jgi:two-component system sensor histidine kinase BaeS